MMNHRGTVSLNIRLFRSAQKLYITSLNYRALMCMVYFLDLQHCSHRSDQKLYTKSQIYIAFMCMIYSLYLQNCCLICMYTWEHKVWAIYTTQPEALWLWIRLPRNVLFSEFGAISVDQCRWSVNVLVEWNSCGSLMSGCRLFSHFIRNNMM